MGIVYINTGAGKKETPIFSSTALTTEARTAVTANQLVAIQRYWNGWSGTLTTPTVPSIQATPQDYCDWSPDSTMFATCSSTSPYVSFYEIDPNTDTVTKWANPDTLPGGRVGGISFHPSGKMVAVSVYATPWIIIYRIDRDRKTLTKLPNPATLPTGNGLACAYNHAGTILSVNHNVTPFITNYRVQGELHTKLANPASLPVDPSTSVQYNDMRWSNDDKMLIISAFVTPFCVRYSVENEVFTKLANLPTLPASSIVATAINWADTLMSVNGLGSSNQLKTYTLTDTTTATFLSNLSVSNNGRGIDYDPTGKFMIASSNTAAIRLHTTTLSSVTYSKTLSPTYGVGLKFSPNGRYLCVPRGVSPWLTLMKSPETYFYGITPCDMNDLSSHTSKNTFYGFGLTRTAASKGGTVIIDRVNL